MAYTSSRRKKHKNKPITNLQPPNKSPISNNQFQKLSDRLITFGYCFLIIGALIFILTFYPVIIEEIKYQLTYKTAQKTLKNVQIKPVDEDFGIVIPKIRANAKVIANVDPYNPIEYQWQLTHGVAHAKGSSLPDKAGNTFIFAHSSGNWYEANRYNSVFYLLNKLKKNDEIDIYYQKNKIRYKVSETKIVNADQINYLSSKPSNLQTLTLMTCWPPGTTLKRLIVVGRISN